MTRRLIIPAVLAATLAVTSAATPASSHAQQRAAGALTWLALGDSYSAGEGLRNNDIAANPPDRTSFAGEPVKAQNCERATGKSTTRPASKTWSVVAREALTDVAFASFTLKACTGAITNEWRKQWEEAGGPTADLVTLSMGGNNVGFADVIMACAGVSVEGGIDAVLGGAATWALNPALGCNVSDSELRHRVDQLVGKDPASPHEAFNKSQTLPDMYAEIAANAVTPGGHVLVLGYPNLIETSGKWTWRLLSGNRCHRVRRADANMLRGVTGYLNEQIALAVQAANNNPQGVHFDFLDVSQVYENDTTGHHGLCTGEPWLNGLTFGVDGPDAGLVGFRPFRSFHPNQLGYEATGRAVADKIRGFDWSTLQPDPSSQCLDTDTAMALLVPVFGEATGVQIDDCYPGRVAIGTVFFDVDAATAAWRYDGTRWTFLAGSFGLRSVCEAVWGIDASIDIGCGTNFTWPYPNYFEVPQLGSEPVRGSGCGADGRLGDTIPDGVWNGYVTTIGPDSLEFDIDCVYYGDSAVPFVQAFIDANGFEPSNGTFYFTVNSTTRTRTVRLAPGFLHRDAQWLDGGCLDPGSSSDFNVPTDLHTVIDSWVVIKGGQAVFVLTSCPYG